MPRRWLKIDEDHDLLLLAYRAMSESPALQSSGANSVEWIERMTATIVGHEPQVDQFEGRILAGAWMGAIDAMMMTWVESRGQSSVVVLTENLIDRLEALLQ